MSTEIALQQQAQPVAVDLFNSGAGFEHAQRVAKALASSTLVPQSYQNNMPNTLVALEMANRIGASPLMVMQNLNVIHGRPSWSSTFIISAINTCGKFTPLRFKISGQGDDLTCVAWAKDKTGEVLEGPPVSIRMAKAEGWFSKNGSKWQTMPELMMRYRAAAFFGRLYAPEVLMGMHSEDEIQDVEIISEQPRYAAPIVQASPAAELNQIAEQRTAPKARGRKPAQPEVSQTVAPEQTVSPSVAPNDDELM